MPESAAFSRSDRVGLYLAAGVFVVGVIIAIYGAVRRLIVVAPGKDIPVTVPVDGERADLPFGPDGAMVPVDVNTATVVVPHPAPATLFALWAQPIWMAVFVCLGLGIAALFVVRLARSMAFSSGTARLAYAGAGTVAVGWFGGTILTNMTTNGALSAVSNYTYDSVIFETSLAPVAVTLLLGAAGAALHIGEKLQRDTAGLV